jgi:hypothetical protein
MSKIVKNILQNWESHMEYGDHRIKGQISVDQPMAFAKRGDTLVTSPIVRFFRVDGVLHLETKNSLYVLID